MNPYLLDFLEGLAGLTLGTAIVAIPYSIWHKNHETPYEKKLKAKWEKEQREKETLQQQTTQPREPRPGSDAHYAAWRAEQLKKKENQ